MCSTLAYSMVLAGARLAPVGYVAALRESSVILGAGAGWLFLHERLGRARLASALVVTAGLVLLIVWQCRPGTFTEPLRCVGTPDPVPGVA